jgi:hypothetical protein
MMPNWLKGMVGPTLMLWLCAIAWGVACIVAPEGKAPKGAGVASGYALPLVLALWVSADARKRGKQLFYDYGSFVFFAWPIMMPVYLFQTRRLRAFLTLLYFAGIWLVAMLPLFVVSIIEEFAP